MHWYKKEKLTTVRRAVSVSKTVRAEDGVMAVHSGLSATVCGYLVKLQRQDSTKTAVVTVCPMTKTVAAKHVPTLLEIDAISVAAEMLRRRAQRFLGEGWTIHPWQKSQAALLIPADTVGNVLQ
jgi:hypothetical protein